MSFDGGNRAAVPSDLVRACQLAQTEGADFPTIWRTILRPHPLVVGIPVQTVTEARAQLEIRLSTGHRLVYDSAHNDYTLVAPPLGG